MFQKAELERLRAQKALLVLQSDTHRLLLAADWQRLRTPGYWLNAAGGLVRRHPIWMAALSAAAGVLLVKGRRKSGSVMDGIGSLGKWISLASSIWKRLHPEKSGE